MGISSKKPDAPYASGKSKSWKVKNPEGISGYADYGKDVLISKLCIASNMFLLPARIFKTHNFVNQRR